MTPDPEFALLPLRRLKAHEEVVAQTVAGLAEAIRRAGVFEDPIWVARGSDVILNGHHRVAALRLLGGVRVPAWLLEYETDIVSVEPWRPGERITKAEVVRRAETGELFPSKTTRHRIRVDLPPHPTKLAELVSRTRRSRAHSRASEPSRRPGAGASGPV